MRSFDLVDSLAVFEELIECSILLRQDFIGDDVFLAENGINVLDHFHGDDFVGQLVILLIEEPAELKVQHEGMPILGLDVVAIPHHNL